jgi:hypothetical protein
MKWVTRERVKVDRVACPWLIRKLVDLQAEFFFVPPDQVIETAARTGAIPYDVPNVELGHHGKECSFDAIVKSLGSARAVWRAETFVSSFPQAAAVLRLCLKRSIFWAGGVDN